MRWVVSKPIYSEVIRMKNINNIASVLFLTLLMYSCSMITESTYDPELRFEKEQFYVENEIIDIYRSLNVISVGLKSDIDLNEFQQYLKSQGLQPITPFSHIRYSTLYNNHSGRNFPLILLLPKNAKIGQFYSYSKDLTKNSFARNPFIEYSLPAYSRDLDGKRWYYLNNIITVKPSTDEFSVLEFSKEFNLEFVSKYPLIEMYTFIDNQFLNGNPYELSNKIYQSGNYSFAIPDAFEQVTLF